MPFDIVGHLRHSLRIFWRHKLLVVLGTLTMLTSGQGGGEAAVITLLPLPELGMGYWVGVVAGTESIDTLLADAQFQALLERMVSLGELGMARTLLWAFGLSTLVMLILAASVVVDGVLLAAVGQIETEGSLRPGEAVQTAWHKAWLLILIISIPPIPLLVTLILSVLVLGVYFRLAIDSGFLAQGPGAALVTALLFGFLALLNLASATVTVVLELIRHMANRACIIEHTHLWASYRRGWEVLRANFGRALLLFIVQAVMRAVIQVGMLFLNALVGVVVLLAPLAWLVRGSEKAYLSTMWTLAWLKWTRSPAAVGEES